MEQKNIVQLQLSNEGMVKDAFLSAQKGILDTFNSIKDKINSLVKNSKDVLIDEKTNINKIDKIEFTKEQKHFLEVFLKDYLNSKENLNLQSKKRFDYINIKVIKAFVPEGMNTTYLECLNEIEKAIKYCIEVNNSNLPRYSKLVADLTTINNFEKLLDSNELIYLDNEKYRNLANSYKDKCYKDNTVTVVKIENVVENLTQWKTVIEKVNYLNTLCNTINVEEILSTIDRVAKLLDILIENKNNKLDNISPEMLRQLTNATYNIAKDLEFISIVKFDLMSLDGSIINTIQNLVENYN